MAADRKILKPRTGGILLLLGCAAALLFHGCFKAPRDKNGNRPEDVADAFIRAVQAGDLSRAAKFWDSGSIKNVQANFRVKFEDFCINKFKCDSYELSESTKGKSGYYHVGFEGKTRDGGTKGFGLYLKLFEGEWLLGEDLWIREATEH